jgi:phage terminase large subunit-like protein
VQFIERYCKHHKGEWAGKPLLLEEWQKDSGSAAFGWLRATGPAVPTPTSRSRGRTGSRTLAGALGLYLLVADGEAGAEIYSSATKKDQARIVWDDGAAMVKKRARSSSAREGVPQQPRRASAPGRSSSRWAPTLDTLDGLNPHGNIVDELHAHKDRGVWDVLDTAMGARRQPLTLAITTAGTYDPESIGWQMHDYAVKVLEGVIEDDAFFAFIAAADEGDDYFSEAAQQKANPNWGVSVKPDYLAKQAQKAQRQPSFTNEYLRLHLNVWTQQVTRWLSLEQWNACDPAAAGADAPRSSRSRARSALEGRLCFGGLDLSTKLDLAALVLAFPGTRATSSTCLPLLAARGDGRGVRAQGSAALRDMGARGLAHEPPRATSSTTSSSGRRSSRSRSASSSRRSPTTRGAPPTWRRS